jgi:adenylate kinase family enzyme
MPEKQLRAIVLLGPTGSGKTPLGEQFALRGFQTRRCVHFDFGANLRAIVARGEADTIISQADIEFLRDVLSSGALLEDKDFPIAARILRSFCMRWHVDPHTVVVLNGLPRHAGQAQALEEWFRVEAVIHLSCTADTVLRRIAANTGGDRQQRTDDEHADIRRKLDIFHQRTKPLIDHYRRIGVPIWQVDVTAEMTPAEMWDGLETSLGTAQG